MPHMPWNWRTLLPFGLIVATDYPQTVPLALNAREMAIARPVEIALASQTVRDTFRPLSEDLGIVGINVRFHPAMQSLRQNHLWATHSSGRPTL